MTSERDRYSGGQLIAADPLEALCRGFSCPFEPWDASFASAIGTARARQALRLFLDQFHEELATHS